MDSTTKTKADLVRSMHTIIKNLTNETPFYGSWGNVLNDEADGRDFVAVAEDEERFTEAVKVFKRIMALYMKEGFSISETVY